MSGSSETLMVTRVWWSQPTGHALVQLVGNHIFGHQSEKRRRSWTATTTRCIAEGIKIRNGLCKSLPSDARRSVHPARTERDH